MGLDSMGTSCASSEPYALQVLDNSMEPEFPDHCIIIIDPFPQADHGAFVFAEYQGERWFRQLQVRNGTAYLVALNGLYPEVEIEGEYTIHGLVVQRNVKRKIKHYPMGQLPDAPQREISGLD